MKKIFFLLAATCCLIACEKNEIKHPAYNYLAGKTYIREDTIHNLFYGTIVGIDITSFTFNSDWSVDIRDDYSYSDGHKFVMYYNIFGDSIACYTDDKNRFLFDMYCARHYGDSIVCHHYFKHYISEGYDKHIVYKGRTLYLQK